MRRVRLLLALLFAAALPAAVAAAPWQVDPARSTFAVLTHPDGVAAGLAHPHVILAVAPRTTLEFDPARPEATRFDFEVPVLALEIDAPETRFELATRLREAGLLDEPLKVISESTREKIRKDALAAPQLFADRFPEIRATLVGFAPRAPLAGAAGELDGVAKVKVEIRGATVERDFTARVTVAPGELRARVTGSLAFTDFGIEPYRALLGAIRNADRFDVYLDVTATPGGAAAP